MHFIERKCFPIQIFVENFIGGLCIFVNIDFSSGVTMTLSKLGIYCVTYQDKCKAWAGAYS